MGEWERLFGSDRAVPDYRGFVALTSLVGLIWVLGLLPSWPGLVLEAGLPPFGLAASLMVLLARGPTWELFVLGLGCTVLVRSVLLALMMGSLEHLRVALRFELVALLPMGLGAELVVAGRELQYAPLWWVGFGVIVLFGLCLAEVPWQIAGSSARDALRRSGSWFSKDRGEPRVSQAIGAVLREGMRWPTVGVYLLVLTFMSDLAGLGRATGRDVSLAAALVGAGALGYLGARRLSQEGSFVVPWRALGVTVFLGASIGLVLAPTGALSGKSRPDGLHPRHGTLFLVPGEGTKTGYGSVFEIDPAWLGFSCSQVRYFSYAGQGSGASKGRAWCPIASGKPYGPADTERRLSVLVATFQHQIAGLEAPVTVLAHSFGGWVAWDAIHRLPPGSVANFVWLAPVDAPIGYPAPGSKSQGGLVGFSGAQGILALGRAIGFTPFKANEPLAVQLAGDPSTERGLEALRRVKGTRVLLVPALLDLPLLVGKGGWSLGLSGVVGSCPVVNTHSGVLTSSVVMALVNGFLDHHPAGGCAFWRSAPHGLGAVWTPPPPREPRGG